MFLKRIFSKLFPKQDLKEIRLEIDGIKKELYKIGREQYKTNNLIESNQAVLNSLIKELMKEIERKNQQLEALQRLKGELVLEAKIGLIKELLPVLDGLEQGINSFSLRNKEKGILGRLINLVFKQNELVHLNGWIEGIKIIYSRLNEILQREGIIGIGTVGEKFNPNLHIAVGVEEDKGVEENTIIFEQLKGYLLGERVIRFAEVIVAKRRGK